jgi:LuxR family transcriptional regulator, maltose regulon positive regulatory protein
VVALALTAMALHAQGEHEAAMVAAERLVRQAQPGGMLRTLVDEGPMLGTVLSELYEARGENLDSPVREYLSAVLAAFAAEPARSAPRAPQGDESGVRNLLSAREREVLALVAAGASNAAIAGALVVSVHTVKSHVKHIFEKLGVESRTQALARARELDLV